MPAKKGAAKKSAAKKSPARKRPATAAPRPDPGEGKGAHVLSLLYYYLAAVAGLGMVIGGGIAVVLGLRTVIFPDDLETARDGARAILHGLAFLAPGLGLMWWHLRQARRRERWAGADVFWGRSLYFHFGALLALGFVTVATTGVLVSLVEVVLPRCVTLPSSLTVSVGCAPDAEHAGRVLLNFALVGLVAAPIFLWHLREGRRATAAGSG